ncbi:MAG: 3-methyl-2-oxobutanoate hydroxymethyltransferase [Proteobacteria bacterium]|nr:3-methyl-2-oxobutanoate hydroxymethyltransferase [Pseudomonadota bacterium]
MHSLQAKKRAAEPITALTAYDATFARLFDEAGIDVLLVGDSLAMAVQGRDTTLPVTLDEMIYHARAVARGARRAHLVGDMPFMTYQACTEDALRNAGRLLSEGAMHAVKLETGRAQAATVRRLTEAGIPVMGHVGLTPQRVHALGGHRVQGRSAASAARIREDARAVAEAGAYAVVLEGIPSALAARITAELEVPTIGIGAGLHCSGQILVCYDLLGLTQTPRPRFVRCYDRFYERGVDAARRFINDVRAATFPGPEHSYGTASNARDVGAVSAAGDGSDNGNSTAPGAGTPSTLPSSTAR